MFGTRAFTVGGRLAVCARADGALLVRVPADQHASLLERPGASPPQMGARIMGRGWLQVSPATLGSADELRCWVEIALTAAADA